MGTRSTYRVIEEFTNKKGRVDSNELVLIYCQYDGYPTGHPIEVCEWLSTGKVVNGISSRDEGLTFNGGGCLGAQLVWFLKKGKVGNVYINPLSTRGNSFEEYMYDIIVKDFNEIKIVCYNDEDVVLFSGSPKEFVEKYSNVSV